MFDDLIALGCCSFYGYLAVAIPIALIGWVLMSVFGLDQNTALWVAIVLFVLLIGCGIWAGSRQKNNNSE